MTAFFNIGGGRPGNTQGEQKGFKFAIVFLPSITDTFYHWGLIRKSFPVFRAEGRGQEETSPFSKPCFQQETAG